jgi:hypothetical protein
VSFTVEDGASHTCYNGGGAACVRTWPVARAPLRPLPRRWSDRRCGHGSRELPGGSGRRRGRAVSGPRRRRHRAALDGDVARRKPSCRACRPRRRSCAVAAPRDARVRPVPGNVHEGRVPGPTRTARRGRPRRERLTRRRRPRQAGRPARPRRPANPCPPPSAPRKAVPEGHPESAAPRRPTHPQGPPTRKAHPPRGSHPRPVPSIASASDRAGELSTGSAVVHSRARTPPRDADRDLTSHP